MLPIFIIIVTLNFNQNYSMEHDWVKYFFIKVVYKAISRLDTRLDNGWLDLIFYYIVFFFAIKIYNFFFLS
jgi:hypothetical protein